ncbi:MAG: hypothetical protein K2L22_06940 [Muribaculaceae bacterium]|nr:hypothetical protein [Muribaculaceae bacterium]
MKRQTLVNGLLTLTAVSFITSCVDDKYDLTDIDTTSRFTVNKLTVPVNLSEIKLENVINLDDNENITVVNGEYVIQKGGSIAPTEFSIGSVEVAAPKIDPTSVTVVIPQLPTSTGLSYIPEFDLPASDLQSYEFKMENVDKALKLLKDVKTVDDITIDVELSVPSQLLGADNKISFKDLKLQLPWGLVTEYKESGEGEMTYNKNTGLLTVPEVTVNTDGKAYVAIKASGLDLGSKGKIENGMLAVSGEVGIKGGSINIDVKNATLPSSLKIVASYNVSGFKLASFSGDIDYKMDIRIAPISLSDLPDFLDNSETNLFIANPEISVDIENPVAKYGLIGEGKLKLTSTFKNGKSISRSSDVFKLQDPDKDGICRIILTPNVIEGQEDMYAFPDLGYVLTYYEKDPAAISLGWGLPESISVGIEDFIFNGHVDNFPLSNIGSASGDYSFKAPLGFDYGSTVFYETTEGDWGSEDLDKVNIKTIDLTAVCSTDLPVSIKLSVVPVDKAGNVIAVNEDNMEFEVPAYADKKTVTLKIEAKNGGTISGFDGVKFKATIEQKSNNTEALGPNLTIKLDDIRVTVDGYYETDF